MLQNLYIKNYALIDKINLSFDTGLTIITGETGAGKSILLGGLELVRGKRAQQGLLKDASQKSIVEATFDISSYYLQDLFESEELDYDPVTIIRRELLPNGKSRAFVNDTPARLESLTRLTAKLLDIHSQYQTLELNDKAFQYELLDAVAGNTDLLKVYQAAYKKYKKLKHDLQELSVKLMYAEQELSYKKHQLQELQAAKLDEVDFEKLEQQIKAFDNLELINRVLTDALQKLDAEETGVLNQIINLKSGFNKIAAYNDRFDRLAGRLESMQWELQDIIDETAGLIEANDFNPGEVARLQERYAAINQLMMKHQVLQIDDLITLRNSLASEVTDLSSLQAQIDGIERDLSQTTGILKQNALKIRKNRQKAIPKLIEQIEVVLQNLSMADTKLKIDLQPLDNFLPNGMDNMDFQISSDKGKSFGSLKRIASGGELSRLMLAVKTVLSKYKQLPTIIFDEIDTGISGDVAQKMANVLQNLSRNMQVIAITHLPQIAVKGDKHFKVYKNNGNDIATQVKLLTDEERVYEIAEMLEGKSPSESALNHARHLLNLK